MRLTSDFSDWIYLIPRIALGILFIFAGAFKLTEPETFAVLIDAYGILPDFLLFPVAIALPLAEVVAGIGLVFDVEGSLETVACLLLLFFGILSYGLWMGLSIDCGCFGPEDPEARAYHGLGTAVIRDAGLMAGVVFLFNLRRARGIKPVKPAFLLKKLTSLAFKRSAGDLG